MKKQWLLLIFVLFVIGISAYAIYNTYQKQEESNLVQGEGEEPESYDYDWKTPLYNRAYEMFNNVFNESNYTFDKNGEFKITFRELQDEYNLDFSKFNTNTISCNLDKSNVVVMKHKLGPVVSVNLECTNSEEN